MIKNSLHDLKQFLFSSKKRILFSIWLLGIIFICLMWVIGKNVNDRTVSISTLFSGLSTFVFWCYRKKIAPIIKRWSAAPRTKFILIGSFGAVWIEFIFWLFEKIFGAIGVAASPNFILDLIATMPWYILMIVLLWRIELSYEYTFTELLLLGGVYELGADGFIGSFLEGTFSLSAILMILLVIPLFVVVYSFMILPCSSLLKEEINRIREEKVTNSNSNMIRMGIVIGRHLIDKDTVSLCPNTYIIL